MGKKKSVTLYSPDGRISRQVLSPSRAASVLRGGGWTETKPVAAAARSEKRSNEAARRARADLERLSPEEWVREWGYVLCSALDEIENSHALVSARGIAAADVMLAGISTIKSVTEACSTWMLRTGWTAGKPLLEPTKERQAAAEDLLRRLLEICLSFRRQSDGFLTAMSEVQGVDVPAVQGDPAARARASGLLDQLAREFPAGQPGSEEIREAVQRVRAHFLGGSNTPRPGDEEDEIPS